MTQLKWSENAQQLEWRGNISKEEVAQHNTADDCWVILKGFVYDITSYLAVHPAGADIILAEAGKDITQSFTKAHRWVAPSLIEKLKIGQVTPA